MRKKIATLLLFFFLAILQISFLPNLFGSNVVPDLLLVWIVVWSTRESFENFWLWAIVAGLILDALSTFPLGLTAVIFLLAIVVIDFLKKRFFVSGRAKSFFAPAIFSVLATIINYFCLMFFFHFTGILEWRRLFLEIFYNLIILAIIYQPAIRWKDIFISDKSQSIVK